MHRTGRCRHAGCDRQSCTALVEPHPFYLMPFFFILILGCALVSDFLGHWILYRRHQIQQMLLKLVHIGRPYVFIHGLWKCAHCSRFQSLLVDD